MSFSLFISLLQISLDKRFGKKFNKNTNHYVNIPYDSKELAKATEPDICQLIGKDTEVKEIIELVRSLKQ